MDVGSELRHLREQRGLSLDELSQRTKITRSILRQIENNQIERLPGGVFTRGFLKAYAREIGIDPADTCERYTAQFVDATPGSETTFEPPPLDAHESTAPATRIQGVGALALTVLLGVGYFAVTRWFDSGSLDRGKPARAEEIVDADRPADRDVAAGHAKVATTGSSDTALVAAAPSLRVDLQARSACWISATADGKRVAYRLMREGERQTVDARDQLVLRVGEPASLDYAINGIPGRALGRAGQPVTVTVTRTNYRTFVRQ